MSDKYELSMGIPSDTGVSDEQGQLRNAIRARDNAWQEWELANRRTLKALEENRVLRGLCRRARLAIEDDLAQAERYMELIEELHDLEGS